MEATLMPHIIEDWTCEYLVQEVEFYVALKWHIVVPNTMCTTCQTLTKLQNPDYNWLRNEQIEQNTSFYPSNSKPSHRLAKGNPSNNPAWNTITRNLYEKNKIELFQDK